MEGSGEGAASEGTLGTKGLAAMEAQFGLELVAGTSTGLDERSLTRGEEEGRFGETVLRGRTAAQV